MPQSAPEDARSQDFGEGHVFDYDSQVDDLAACGCGKIFTDKAAGKPAARPDLGKALACLRGGDVFLGAIDEFQRELIVEGTREGLQAARARGRTGAASPR